MSDDNIMNDKKEKRRIYINEMISRRTVGVYYDRIYLYTLYTCVKNRSFTLSRILSVSTFDFPVKIQYILYIHLNYINNFCVVCRILYLLFAQEYWSHFHVMIQQFPFEWRKLYKACILLFRSLNDLLPPKSPYTLEHLVRR